MASTLLGGNNWLSKEYYQIHLDRLSFFQTNPPVFHGGDGTGHNL